MPSRTGHGLFSRPLAGFGGLCRELYIVLGNRIGKADVFMAGALFFISLLGYALAGMVFLPRLRMGAALLCAYCAMLFISFYGVIVAGWMVPVAYALLYGGLGCLALGAAACLTGRRGLRKRVFCPELALYAGLCLLFALSVRGTLIQDHDSLSFWARSVRELFAFDTFYIRAGSTMFHQDYIPLLASLQYCIVRVFGWQDMYLSYTAIACVAVCAAAVCGLFAKRWMGLAAGLLTVLGYRAFGFDATNLRADGPMCLLFTAALVTLYGRQDDDATTFAPALCASAVLTGFKIYTGLLYATLVALAMLLQWRGLRKAGARSRAAEWMALCALLLAVLMEAAWSVKYNLCTLRAAGAQVTLGAVLAGNPRTSRLLHAFTPENLARFRVQAADTWEMYRTSGLGWMWLAWLPAAGLYLAAPSPKRRRFLGLTGWLLLAALIYVLGLFGSYFVQAETAGAAASYLATATTPLLVGAFFLTLWLAQTRAKAALALFVLGSAFTLCLAPPSLPSAEEPQYEGYAALARGFYQDEITLLPEDADKRAILIDCAWESSQIKSQSGKTHAYGYFALPVRVEEPLYFLYGDYTQLETFDGDALLERIQNDDSDLLLMRVEDELYWDEICYALDLPYDEAQSIGVYEIDRSDGGCTFTLREE